MADRDQAAAYRAPAGGRDSSAGRSRRVHSNKPPPFPPATYPRRSNSETATIKQWSNQDGNNSPPGRRPSGDGSRPRAVAKGGGTPQRAGSQPRGGRVSSQSGAGGAKNGGGTRSGSAIPGGGGGGDARDEKRDRPTKQRRTLSAPAAGQRRSTHGGKRSSEAKKGGGDKGGGGGANGGSARNGATAVGTRAALQELLSDGGRRTLPLTEPARAPTLSAPAAYRAPTHLSSSSSAAQSSAYREAARLAECDPYAPVLTLPWAAPSTRPPRAPPAAPPAAADPAGGHSSSSSSSHQQHSHHSHHSQSSHAPHHQQQQQTQPQTQVNGALSHGGLFERLSPRPSNSGPPSRAASRGASPRPANGASPRVSPRSKNGSPRVSPRELANASKERLAAGMGGASPRISPRERAGTGTGAGTGAGTGSGTGTGGGSHHASRGASPRPRGAAAAPTAAPSAAPHAVPPPRIGTVPPPANATRPIPSPGRIGGGASAPIVPAMDLKAVSSRGSSAAAAAAPSAAAAAKPPVPPLVPLAVPPLVPTPAATKPPPEAPSSPYVSSSDPESSDDDDDAATATSKAIAALAAAAGGARPSGIPAHMAVSPKMPSQKVPGSRSMPSLGLSMAGLTGGGGGLLGGIGGGMGGMGGEASNKTPQRAGGPPPGLSLGLGGGLKLDLSKLEQRAAPVDWNERPDDEGRQPPTPTALIVERLKAAAAAAAAEKAAAEQQADGAPPVPPVPPVPGLTHSTSLPDARLGRADLNIASALQQMSIQELSVALSHHSSNRSLLGSASWAVDASEIKFGKRLGAGAYGEVYEADWRRSRVAVKRLLHAHPLEEKGIKQFFAEMDILANARHDNIVRFLGGCVQPDNLCILFEFCPQSLYDLLRKATAPLALEQILSLARQVALGIYYLHCCKPPVLHLDLKSANVLLDRHGHAKVCDFGLAHLKLGNDVRTERMGSPMWTSPEVLKGDARNEKADTYSYGMLLFELLTRELPYGGYAAAQVVMGVITNLLPRPELPADAQHYPPALEALMKECWAFEAEKRPDFARILDKIERCAKEEGMPFADASDASPLKSARGGGRG